MPVKYSTNANRSCGQIQLRRGSRCAQNPRPGPGERPARPESLAQRLFPGNWEGVPALGKIRRSTGFIDRMRPNQVGERQGGKREGE